jgi:hypothetical protein
MVDWMTIIFTGFATGVGIETSKLIHEWYIAPRLKKMKDNIDKLPNEIRRVQDESGKN